MVWLKASKLDSTLFKNLFDLTRLLKKKILFWCYFRAKDNSKWVEWGISRRWINRYNGTVGSRQINTTRYSIRICVSWSVFKDVHTQTAMNKYWIFVICRADFTSGTITINDRPRDLKLFRNQAAYIMQDDLLHSHITAWEAMYFAVNLKIGSQLKRNEKKLRVS